MSSIKKSYVLSIYEDQLVDGKFIEQFLGVIGSNEMDSQNRAFNPKHVQNINGTNTLTFSMYYKYIDTMTGEEVENPFVPYLMNERKIKLYYPDANDDEKWYDFIIKDIKQDTTKQTFDVTCSDQHINELSKNGFNVEFQTDLMNNQGSIQDLGGKIVEGTEWIVPEHGQEIKGISKSEFIPAFSEENLVRLTVLQNIKAHQIIDPIDGSAPSIEDDADINQDAIVYAFYSSCTSKPYRFQFFYFGDKTEISKSDDRIVTEPNCQYYIDYPVFPYNEEADEHNFYVPKDDFEVAPNYENIEKDAWNYTSSIGVCINIKGRRYNYINDGQYNSLFEKYLTPYKKDGIDYLCEEDVKYISPNIIQNLITNPEGFKATSGWKVISFQKSNPYTLQVESYAENSTKVLTQALIDGELSGTEKWVPNLQVVANEDSAQPIPLGDKAIVNSGFYDNRKLVADDIIEDKKFTIKYIIKNVNGTQIGPTRIEIAKHKLNINGYYERDYDILAECNNCSDNRGELRLLKSISKEDFLKEKYQIFIYGNNISRIEKFELFPKYEINNTVIEPGSTDNLNERSIIDKRYKLYEKTKVDEQIEINGSLDALTVDYEYKITSDEHPEPEYNGFTPILSCEKVRTIEVKESNYFNAIQELCEKFEAWAKFEFTRDAQGAIINKYITFHNYIGQDNFAGIKYGVNLKSIQRSDDSKQIVTKLIVKQNSNEFGKNGFSTIARAPSNETGDTSIYNMNYYIQQGLLDAAQWEESIYDTSSAEGRDTIFWSKKEGNNFNITNLDWDKYNVSVGEAKVLQYSCEKEQADEIFFYVHKWSLGHYIQVSAGGNEFSKDFVADININSYEDLKNDYGIEGNYNSNTGTTYYNIDFTQNVNSNGYYVRLRNLNKKLDEINIKLDQYYLPYTQAKADLEKWTTAYNAAMETYEEESAKFLKALGFDWRNINTQLYTVEKAEGITSLNVRIVDPDKYDDFLAVYGYEEYEIYQPLSSPIVLQKDGRSIEEGEAGLSIICTPDKVLEGGTCGHITFLSPYFGNTYCKDLTEVDVIDEASWTIGYINWTTFYTKVKSLAGDNVFQTYRIEWNSDDTFDLYYKNSNNNYVVLRDIALSNYGISNNAYPRVQNESYVFCLGAEPTESKKAKVQSTQFRPYLVNVSVAYQQVFYTREQKEQAEKAEAKYKQLYDNLLEEYKLLVDKKTALNIAFYKKFNRFIQEGTWINEEYYDDEKYYQDALSVLYNSCYPKVSYTINALELSQLEGYEDFKFRVGDRTYIEDPEYYGYIDDQGTPYRELVTLSEISYSLDEPDKNTIKVQNYKNAFQDLFQRISATVQSVQYTTGAYERAADLAAADTKKKIQYLTDALNSASMILQNMGDQTVTWDNTGITIQDSIEQNNLLRIVSRGILLSIDGGTSWRTGITAEGISANVITAGTINTETINIMNGKNATFVWNSYGLNAYDQELTGTEGTYFRVNTQKGVRFDRFGLYGYNITNGTGADFKPTNQEDIDQIAKFALTWEGLKIYQKNTETNKNEAVFYADDQGNLNLKGIITATGGSIGALNIKHSTKKEDYYLEFYDKEKPQLIDNTNYYYGIGLSAIASEYRNNQNVFAIGLIQPNNVSWSNAAFRVTGQGDLYSSTAHIAGNCDLQNLSVQKGIIHGLTFSCNMKTSGGSIEIDCFVRDGEYYGTMQADYPKQGVVELYDYTDKLPSTAWKNEVYYNKSPMTVTCTCKSSNTELFVLSIKPYQKGGYIYQAHAYTNSEVDVPSGYYLIVNHSQTTTSPTVKGLDTKYTQDTSYQCKIEKNGKVFLEGATITNNSVASSTSSSRLAKKEIESFVPKYDIFFDNLIPRTFMYNREKSDRIHFGFILDEVRASLDKAELTTLECGAYCLDDINKPDGYGGIRYEEFISLNTWQIQKLKKRISELEEKINFLEENNK